MAFRYGNSGKEEIRLNRQDINEVFASRVSVLPPAFGISEEFEEPRSRSSRRESRSSSRRRSFSDDDESPLGEVLKSPGSLYHSLGLGMKKAEKRGIGVISGLPCILEMECDDVRVERDGEDVVVRVGEGFGAGSVVVFETMCWGVQAMNTLLGLDEVRMLKGLMNGDLSGDVEEVESIVRGFGGEEVNVVLFRVDEEEKDMIGSGVYNVPGYGDLAYAGLLGFMHVFEKTCDLGHPVYENLRRGDWMYEYILMRLSRYIER